MSTHTIPIVYAQTLYQIAAQKNILTTIYTDTSHLLHLYQHHKTFKTLVQNPTLSPTYQQKILQQTIKPYFHHQTLAYLLFIIQKKRYTYLKHILEAFITHYKQQHHIQIAHVTTPQTLNPTLKKQLLQLAIRLTQHKHIQLIQHTNPSLLGGFILKIKHHQIDTTLTTQLKRFKNTIITHHA